MYDMYTPVPHLLFFALSIEIRLGPYNLPFARWLGRFLVWSRVINDPSCRTRPLQDASLQDASLQDASLQDASLQDASLALPLSGIQFCWIPATLSISAGTPETAWGLSKQTSGSQCVR